MSTTTATAATVTIVSQHSGIAVTAALCFGLWLLAAGLMPAALCAIIATALRATGCALKSVVALVKSFVAALESAIAMLESVATAVDTALAPAGTPAATSDNDVVGSDGESSEGHDDSDGTIIDDNDWDCGNVCSGTMSRADSDTDTASSTCRSSSNSIASITSNSTSSASNNSSNNNNTDDSSNNSSDSSDCAGDASADTDAHNDDNAHNDDDACSDDDAADREARWCQCECTTCVFDHECGVCVRRDCCIAKEARLGFQEIDDCSDFSDCTADRQDPNDDDDDTAYYGFDCSFRAKRGEECESECESEPEIESNDDECGRELKSESTSVRFWDPSASASTASVYDRPSDDNESDWDAGNDCESDESDDEDLDAFLRRCEEEKIAALEKIELARRKSCEDLRLFLSQAH